MSEAGHRSRYHDGQSHSPPTRVSWAPRKIALTSKLDMSNCDISTLSMFAGVARVSGSVVCCNQHGKAGADTTVLHTRSKEEQTRVDCTGRVRESYKALKAESRRSLLVCARAQFALPTAKWVHEACACERLRTGGANDVPTVRAAGGPISMQLAHSREQRARCMRQTRKAAPRRICNFGVRRKTAQVAF